MLPARPLTLETYHRFFLDPWNTRITVDQLNQILYMHGFAKLHRGKKAKIMEHLVGQVDLLPPRRSTLHQHQHRAALSVASPPSAAVITAAQARDDVEAIGWAECPIGCVAAFAAPSADVPEPVERVPRPADFVLAGRRPRSKRTRGSAYGPRDVAAASMKLKAWASAPGKQAKVVVKEEEREPELVPPPPLWTRSPTPPPPQDVAPPPPPCQPQPTLAPIPAPPGWCTPMVPPHPSQQLFWGLPLPTRPTAQPFPATPPPGWSVPTPPPCFPAPFWGAPTMLPPLPPHVAWRWPPTTPPHWGSMFPPENRPMQLQRSPPPLLLQQPPPHFQGQPLPSLIHQTPPPPLLLQQPLPHLQRQPLPVVIQTPPPPLLLQQPPLHLQGQPLPALRPTPPPPALQHYPWPHFGGQHPPPALHQERCSLLKDHCQTAQRNDSSRNLKQPRAGF